MPARLTPSFPLTPTPSSPACGATRDQLRKVPTPLRTDIYRNTLGRNAITNTGHFAGSPPYSKPVVFVDQRARPSAWRAGSLTPFLSANNTWWRAGQSVKSGRASTSRSTVDLAALPR